MTEGKKLSSGESNALCLKVHEDPSKPRPQLVTDVALGAATSNAATAMWFANPLWKEVGLTEATQTISNQVKEVQSGNMASVEALLVSQAVALNAMFAELARRASLNFGEYLDASEKYTRLALKAQSNCRATLETLAAIKNPPVVYARQANIANGPQQVNNGVAREGKSIPSNELLEADHGQRLDAGTTGEAGGSDQALETVGEVNRAQKRRGEG